MLGNGRLHQAVLDYQGSIDTLVLFAEQLQNCNPSGMPNTLANSANSFWTSVKSGFLVILISIVKSRLIRMEKNHLLISINSVKIGDTKKYPRTAVSPLTTWMFVSGF